MIILTLRTDKPEAEIGLYNNVTQLGYDAWYAHRELSETLHARITTLLEGNQKKLQDIQGIIVYAGPGSFTGLRIGISVANALAYSLNIPVVDSTGDAWIKRGCQLIITGKAQINRQVVPIYGAPVHITLPRK